jgi:hypothetical protein
VKRATESFSLGFDSQPSASQTPDWFSDVIPPMNRRAIIIRPLRGLKNYALLVFVIAAATFRL